MTYTLTAVRSWSRATLDDRANTLASLSDSFRQQLGNADSAADGIVGGGWGGDAGSAAYSRIEKEIRLGRTTADALDDLVEALRRHAGSIQGVRDNVLAKVAGASDEFTVSDDFQVDHSGPEEKRQIHVDAITAALSELAEVDREVSFVLDACCDEIAACAEDSSHGDDYSPPATLTTMTTDDVTRQLADPAFAEWIAEHPDAAKSLLDAAVDAGTLSPTSTVYTEFLQGFWQREALERAGIDVSQWNPELGAEANADTITKVYEYYGQLFLDHPSLQWAGMANMIGPSFAGGFYDLDMMRTLASSVSDIDVPLDALDDYEPVLDALASLPESEIAFYETTLLSMQKEIFFDQGAMHEAYLVGGAEEMDRMLAADLIDRPTRDAWNMIERGEAANNDQLLAEGNKQLLRREQWDIIADDYDRMRNREGTGAAVTWGITAFGAPSIPDAQTYSQVFPEVISRDIPIPFLQNIPFVTETVTVDVNTPFPDGNISNADQRWNLITEDTLPAYQSLLAEDPDRAREIVSSDFGERLESQRVGHTVDDILARLVTGFSVDFGG